MAVTETLETVFILKGVESAIAGFAKISNAARTVATEEQALTARTSSFATALTSAFGAVGGAAGIFALLTREIQLATDTWAADEQQIFRTAIVLRNMKSSLPIEELQAYSATLQQSVAIDDEAIVALGGLLSRFKLTGDEIKRAIPVILDTSKATGESVESIGERLGITLSGQRNSLRDLGVEYKRTGDRVKDLSSLLGQLEDRFKGAAKAERDTTAGSRTAFAEELANLRSSLGQGFEQNVGRPGRELFTRGLQRVNQNPNSLLALLSGVLPQFASFFNSFQNKGTTNPAAEVGTGKGPAPATEEEQKRQTELLGKMNDAFVKQVLGGGALARGALNIRSLNAAIRSSR